jgi:CHAT domain-containing protein
MDPKIADHENLVIIPQHVLHYFPFAALVVEKDARDLGKHDVPSPMFLIDEPIDISYSPSLHFLNHTIQQPRPKIEIVHGAGLVKCPGVKPDLEGVKKDMDLLKLHFGDSVKSILREERANKIEIVSKLKQPGLILLAMHGINTPEQPLESHLLLFPNGERFEPYKFTAREIYSLEVNKQLIVLSACYSGLSDRAPMQGDDLFGIKRALLSAGTKTVVSGLWDVFDKTGPDIIGEFHRRISAGENSAQALANTQREFLKIYRASGENEPFLHPHFWAVFTVSGDFRTTLN